MEKDRKGGIVGVIITIIILIVLVELTNTNSGNISVIENIARPDSLFIDIITLPFSILYRIALSHKL